MPFGELVAILKTKSDMSQTFGLEMKVPKKEGMVFDGVRLIFDSDTPASVCFLAFVASQESVVGFVARSVVSREADCFACVHLESWRWHGSLMSWC